MTVECPICSSRFDSPNELMIHRANAHKQATELIGVSTVGEKGTVTVKDIPRVKEDAALPEKKLPEKKCKICRVLRPTVMFAKEPNNKDGRKKICRICKSRAYGMMGVDAAQAMLLAGPPYICPACGAPFETERGVANHYVNLHALHAPPEKAPKKEPPAKPPENVPSPPVKNNGLTVGFACGSCKTFMQSERPLRFCPDCGMKLAELKFKAITVQFKEGRL